MPEQIGNPPVASPSVPSDAATLQLLVQLLLAERQEAMQDRQEKAKALAAKNAQRVINAEYVQKEKNTIQSICTHKKGGRGIKSPKTDYAVYFHTFTDNTSYIRCQICGMRWRVLDTKESIYRNGKQLPNHTGIGWREAFEMLSNSTNTPSSSEVKMATQPIPSNVADLP